MSLPKDVQVKGSTRLDSRRNRLAGRLANVALLLATPLYRDFISGSIRYGMEAAIKAADKSYVDQWGVRFGDGEIDAPYNDREYAQAVIDQAREHIAEDPRVADDYEPMALLHRTFSVQSSPWLEVPA